MKNLDSVCIVIQEVDSSVVASLAFEQLGNKAIAITGISPALANSLVKKQEVKQVDWRKHLEIQTSELTNQATVKNQK